MTGKATKLQEKRLAFYDRAERMTPFVGTRAGAGVFIVRTRDKNVGRSLFASEGRGEMNVLMRALTVIEAIFGPKAIEDKTFVDVGANIGTTTIPAIIEHGFARAVALEPEADNHRLLRLNVLLNEIDDRVTTVQRAASNRDGTAELIVNPEQAGKHWIAMDDDKKSRMNDDEDAVEVETVTLDALAASGVLDPDEIGMLWVDAQSHEGQILEGATELTRRGVPIVLELDPKGLAKRGDRAAVEEIATANYTHFAGMRGDREEGGRKFSLQPIAELAEFAERHLGPGRTTDVLFLRLAEGEEVEEDLSELINLATAMRRETQAQAQDETGVESVAATKKEDGQRTKTRRRKAKGRQTKEQRGRVRAERAEVKALRAQQKRNRDSVGGEPDASED
jgi:FkbM family methyltransferase